MGAWEALGDIMNGLYKYILIRFDAAYIVLIKVVGCHKTNKLDEGIRVVPEGNRDAGILLCEQPI